MDEIQIISVTPENISKYGVCGYKDVKRPGYPEKIAWMNENFKKDLSMKVIYSETDGVLGQIETIPGENCWRPVEAAGYLFIHCIFAGFRNIHKGKGYASRLIQDCIQDAKAQKRAGVAVMTREGPFMAGNAIFLKNGFKPVDSAKPDFELLVYKLDEKAANPKFQDHLKNIDKTKYPGLKIFRASQCPYTVKNVNDMLENSEKEFGFKPEVVELHNCTEAQNSPSAYGTFCVVHNGEVLSHHPISGTRFSNIIRKIKL